MRQVYDKKDLYLTLGGLVSDYIVVTANHKKSAEVIVGRNTEGPNKIQFMSFIIVRQFLKTICGYLKKYEGWKLNKRKKGVNKVWK